MPMLHRRQRNTARTQLTDPEQSTEQGGNHMDPKAMIEVVAGKRYRTETAQLLASDSYLDGGSYERAGRNTFLFCTPNGNYFMQHQTSWERERDCLSPLPRDEALRLFTELPAKLVDFEEAFPGIEVEDA